MSAQVSAHALASPPVIGITACIRTMDASLYHCVDEKYICAVTDGVGGVPLLIPALGHDLDINGLIPVLDGLLAPGSLSNIESHRFGETPSTEGGLLNPMHDSSLCPLLLAAITAGLPLLAISRGHHALNVALGGSLHRRLQRPTGRMNHRAPKGADLDRHDTPAHPVTLTEGGLFERLNRGERRLYVNSSHEQGIDRLAEGLEVEAVADDGAIEALRVTRIDGFAISVQWNPEYKLWENPFSVALFEAFSLAARARADYRHLH